MGSSGHRRSEQSARKAFALALLGPFFLAPTLGVLHLALVRHVTCPEHGELVELATAVSNSTNDAAPGVESDVPAANDLHQHHHCEVVPQRLNPASRVGKAATELTIAERSIVTVQADAAVPARSVDVLRFAPKASPPV